MAMRTLLRRDFLKELALLPAVLRQRDKFGGSPDVRFKGTGFFRLEKKDRWWLDVVRLDGRLESAAAGKAAFRSAGSVGELLQAVDSGDGGILESVI
jgi:hypothetical protein